MTTSSMILSPILKVKLLADSVSTTGVRLTTLELTYPRFIHAELLTHRVFSRNASSSRAIPTKRAIKMIRDNPAVPASWRMNQPGMQGYEVASEETTLAAQAIWLGAMEDAIRHAEAMDELGIHKQVVNRITEPYAHIKVVLTSVYWENWDGLRRHDAADPTICALAEEIYSARTDSTPVLLHPGEWHLPYITEEELTHYGSDLCKKISAARCARVSYNNHDGTKTTLESDLNLHDKLLVDQPIHSSPAEHQARPDTKTSDEKWQEGHLAGNLTGWCQYRKTLANENMDKEF